VGGPAVKVDAAAVRGLALGHIGKGPSDRAGLHPAISNLKIGTPESFTAMSVNNS
jgi:hypothetical protein